MLRETLLALVVAYVVGFDLGHAQLKLAENKPLFDNFKCSNETTDDWEESNSPFNTSDPYILSKPELFLENPHHPEVREDHCWWNTFLVLLRNKDTGYRLRWESLHLAGKKYELKEYWQQLGGPVKILFPGYSFYPSRSIEQQYHQLVQIYLEYQRQNYNVILVEWATRYAEKSNLDFGSAPKHIPILGECLKNSIGTLTWEPSYHQLKIKKEQIHLIGVSLGAHLAAYAGEHVARITGIDPYGPDFRRCGIPRLLKKTDAAFVDIIHCNAGCEGHDSLEPICPATSTGHVDVIVNDGVRQPGCLVTSSMGCSHDACLEYFKQSITTDMVACRITYKTTGVGFTSNCIHGETKIGERVTKRSK